MKDWHELSRAVQEKPCYLTGYDTMTRMRGDPKVPSGAAEKASNGLSLLKEAIVELAEANVEGVTNADCVKALGLQSHYHGGYKNWLSYSVLGLLLDEGRLKRDDNIKKGRHVSVLKLGRKVPHTDLKVSSKASNGLSLLKEAIVELAEANVEGVTNAGCANALGLQSHYNGGSINYLSWSVLGLLLDEGRLKRGDNTKKYRYFSVLK